jgi:hypothetical protein
VQVPLGQEQQGLLVLGLPQEPLRVLALVERGLPGQVLLRRVQELRHRLVACWLLLYFHLWRLESQEKRLEEYWKVPPTPWKIPAWARGLMRF